MAESGQPGAQAHAAYLHLGIALAQGGDHSLSAQRADDYTLSHAYRLLGGCGFLDLALYRGFDLVLDLIQLLFDMANGFERLAGSLHLLLERFNVALEDRNLQFAFGTRLLQHLTALILDLLKVLLKVGGLCLEPGTGLFKLLTLARGAVTLLAYIIQQLIR